MKKLLIFHINRFLYRPQKSMTSVRTSVFLCSLCASVVFISHSHAQLLTPLSNEMNRRVEWEMVRTKTPFITVMKPYYDGQVMGKARQDSLEVVGCKEKVAGCRLQVAGCRKPGTDNNLSDTSSSPNHLITSSLHPPITSSPHHLITSINSWLKRKFLYESFLQVDSPDFYLFADPVFEFGVGKDNSGRKTYVNTRGFRAGGRLGKYFAFGSDFYENQSLFPELYDKKYRQTMIIPGQGRGRVNGNVWDYAYTSGYLSFSVLKNLNVQMGQGKQFIGDGYRSLILSDATYNYPYFKTTWQSRTFMYSWMLLLTQNMGIPYALNDKEPYKRETASMHLLSLNVPRWCQLSLIQFDMFNNPDTFGKFTPEFRLFNPVMMPSANSKSKHSLWGINLKVMINRTIWLYGQGIADNLFTTTDKRLAFQAGFKYFDVAGIHGLYLQAEYNQIEPYMYTSVQKPLQWMHYGESLAHPYGHNIQEGIVDISYTRKRWQIENHFAGVKSLKNLAVYKDIIKPGLPYNTTGQKMIYNNLRISYYLNQKTLMNFSLGYTYQKEVISGNTGKMDYIYIAFRTGLRNVY